MAELLEIAELPDSLRVINLAGEPLHSGLVRRLRDRLNSARVFNLYGPSEDTTYSTYQLVDGAGPREPAIGKPITKTRAYILDRQMGPVPVGVGGELYIAGEGLARGYFRRPGITAEKFLPDPFSKRGGERLYKTGDLARYLAEGSIEFLGRLDHQVKVRGYRIELGEVEGAMLCQPGVRQCVAVVRQGAAGDRRLVAYVVADAGSGLSADELRRGLKQRLPEYMVPADYLFLEALPLTPNGKVDRQSLPPPVPARAGPGGIFEPPRNLTEQVLVGIWAELLGVEQVGVNNNFFDLGGHSLLVTQLISRVREAFKTDLPLRSLFEAPTIAQLSELIEKAKVESLEPPTAITKRSRAFYGAQACSLETLPDVEGSKDERGI